MDQLIKFLTAEQSQRNQVFMFLWRILMAILLTNFAMDQLGFTFTKKEISANLIFKFILSTEFLLATFWYLIFIFLFFWFFKILGLGIMYFKSKNQMTKEEVLRILIKTNQFIFPAKKENEKHGIKNLDVLKAVIKDKNNPSNSRILTILANYNGVLLSTIMAVIFIFPFYKCLLSTFLICIFLLLLILSYFIINFYAKTDNLKIIRKELKIIKNNNAIE